MTELGAMLDTETKGEGSVKKVSQMFWMNRVPPLPRIFLGPDHFSMLHPDPPAVFYLCP